MEYLKHHVNNPAPPIPTPLPKGDLQQVVSDFDYEFVSSCSQTTLFEIMVTANYLEIPPLLELTQAYIASLMYGKTPQEVRHIFGIQDNTTPEEEQEIYAKYGHILNA